MEVRADLICDAGDLSSTNGLFLLITRLLDRLRPGQMLHIISSESSVEHDLPAWSRLTANTFLGVRRQNGRVSCFIEKGQASRILTRESADWGQRAEIGEEGFDTRAWLIGRAGRIPESADPADGFAPRGAIVEAGSPAYPFDVLEAGQAWCEEAAVLYDQAAAGHWDGARDIPWRELKPIDDELERAVCQVMTFLAENEYSALYVPAKWIARIHPHFAETVMFLSTQVRDEARHIEVFVKRALANGGGLQFSTASTQASLKSLLDQEDFLQASFLLSVLGEGTFLDLLKYVETYAPEPVTREIARRTRIDESRHVHFALTHVRHALQLDPALKQKLRRAVLDRASVLSEIKGLNPLVEESLAILAAAGLSPHRLPEGLNARSQLYTTMHENRVKRLVMVGFSEPEAMELSDLHTPNFM
jgi:TusA-related sulfurtransferase